MLQRGYAGAFLAILWSRYLTTLAQVARTNPTVEVFSQDLTPVDYNIMGDIASVLNNILITSPPAHER